MPLRRSILILILIHGFAFGGLVAQEIPRSVSVSVWRTQDGLPDQLVQALAEDKDGYLWLGTPSGLVRFDGSNFTKYSGSGSDALSNGVISLLASSEGSLFAGTEGGGLVRIRDGKAIVYGAQQGLSNPIVRSLLEDSRKRIWAGTDYGLFRLEGTRFVSSWGADVRAHIGAAAFTEDREGSIWTGTSALIKLTPDGRDVYPLPEQNTSTRLKAVIALKSGEVLAGDDAGIVSISPQIALHRVAHAPLGVRCFTRLPSGQLLVCTASSGAFVLEADDTFTAAEFNERLPSRNILCGFRDRAGQTWLGTEAGLVRLAATAIRIRTLPTADFATISSRGDGTFWWASGHVYRVEARRSVASGLPWLGQLTVRTTLQSRDGALWVGTAGRGVYRLAPGATSPEHLTQGVGVSYVRGFFQAHDGSIWIATDGGVSHWRSGSPMEDYQRAPGAPHTEVLSVAEDDNDTLWVGTRRGLYRLQHGVFEQVSTRMHLPDSPVWCLLMDAQHQLWAGTNAGLFLLTGRTFRHIALPSLLHDAAVYSILEASGGILWVATPNAVASVSQSDLMNASGRPQAKIFPITPAFPTARLFAGLQPSAVLAADGPWYASSEGPIHIAAGFVPASARPRMVLASLVVDGRTVAPVDSLSLAAGTRTLQINFLPVLTSSQSGLTFRYRLFPLSDWSTASEQRIATYTNLPAGRYQFEVQSLDGNGQVLSEVRLAVRQYAHFYQRIWFWMGCGVFLCSLGLLLHWLRMQQQHRRLEAVANERNRLAREMHDTLIQGCTAVSALLEAVAGKEQMTEAGTQWMNVARDQVKTTIVEARAAVWDLRTREDTPSLEQALRRMACEVGHIDTAFIKEGIVPDLSLATTHELSMSAREALINSSIHSRATRIEVHLKSEGKRVEIKIIDNGQGFSEAEVSALPGHFGLTGMKERMKKIGGSCSIATDPENGTVVCLSYTIPSQR